ncbi:MAG: uroporphyrinogen decarboxylase family protein [Planctomycetia bacterium]|nr:uroporphyrinogen decarboxylase family protein [Planctomycetia bacterium]
MTPRDRVINTIFRQIYHPLPTVLTFPRDYAQENPGASEELQRRFPSDVEFLDYVHFPNQGMDAYVDAWGCIWKRDAIGQYYFEDQPICGNYDQLNDLVLSPIPVQSREIENVNRFCEKSTRFVVANIPLRMFERLQTLLGQKQALLGVRKMQSDILAFLDRLFENYMKQLDIWCQSDVDAICMADAWVHDDERTVSPERWREVFGPYWKKFTEKIRNSDKFVYFQSEGNYEAFIPSLIDCGVEVIRYNCLDMDNHLLSERYGSQVAFHAVLPVDLMAQESDEVISQKILDVRQAFHHRHPLITECRFRAHTPLSKVTVSMLNWKRRMPAGQ